MKLVAILAGLCMAASLVLAAPVLGAVPGNDVYGSRIVIGSVPFSGSVDTTEATTDGDDAEAKGICNPPATDASVWYEMTATSDGGIVVDVSGSSYSAAVVVATGGPGSFAFVTCGPGGATFATTAGETYAILAFDSQLDGGGNGGTLNITVAESPPPPEVDVTVDPVGHFNRRTGTTTVTGTVACTGGANLAFVSVQLQQTVGAFVVTGTGGIGALCAEAAQPWSAQVFSEGRFVGGRADAMVFAQACGPSGCGFDSAERVVTLRGGGK